MVRAIPRRSSRPDAAPPRVAVIGGGFSGCMIAANLARSGFRGEVDIFETAPLGAGVAYADAGDWVLNVRADRMGAFSDEIDGFSRWLRQNNSEFGPNDYAPRTLYGRYIAELFDTAILDDDSPTTIRVVPQRVGGIHALPLQASPSSVSSAGIWRVDAPDGTRTYDAVALCVGLGPARRPRELAPLADDRRMIDQPWNTAFYAAIGKTDAVAIIGSGLTALDALCELEARGHRGPITMLSRRGLTPRPHITLIPPPPPLPVAAYTPLLSPELSLRHALRIVRELIAAHEARGGDWRSVIDGLRPITAEVWRRFDLPDRKRFATRLAAWWDVHRHRAPPAAHACFERGVQLGQIELLAGRVFDVEPSSANLAVRLQRRGADEVELRTVNWVVSCTGPSPDPTTWGNPVLDGLIESGILTVDETRLGVRTDDFGRPRNRAGATADSLFVVGSLRRADLWESIAVPELREQAASAAAQLASLFSPVECSAAN